MHVMFGLHVRLGPFALEFIVQCYLTEDSIMNKQRRPCGSFTGQNGDETESSSYKKKLLIQY